MLKKYSKSYGNMWAFKDALTSDNNQLLQNQKRIMDLYNI